MKKNKFKKRLLVPLLCLFFGSIVAQDLFVENGGAFYLSASASSNFTTSNTLVTHHANGVFAEEAGSNWITETEYVNGKVTVIGAGSTVVNIGENDQSTVTITTIDGDSAICDYTEGTPPVGSVTALGNYLLSDVEYWTVTNTGPSIDLVVSDLTEKIGATYEGVESEGQEIIIVRLDGADWRIYSESPGTGQFALALDNLLGIEDENQISNLISVYPNPVKTTTRSIYFNVPSSVQQLDVIMFDVTGKTVQQYNNIPVKTGVNSLSKPIVAMGLYFLKFSINNGKQQITKKIIIE